MSLSVGVRLGPYEVTGTLGAGGMGEVYRARDARLGRDVALKVLPEAFADDPDRLARFQREAQVLASLNHPHIAAIHGLEEGSVVGADFSRLVRALVLELVEGETLADRIRRGPIPIDEALPIAKQIAEALEAAHEHGVIHRDLKPANIKVTPDGVVKVLDFGLAKLTDTNVASGLSRKELDVTASPTITSPALMTGVGTLLGTAAYMAPEQAKGRPADKRSDVWAFGCVLYEMLTGKRAFEGGDVSDTLAAVLRAAPVWDVIPQRTPPAVVALLRACLEKDRHRRAGDLAAARLVLEHLTDVSTASAAGGTRPRWVAVAAAALVLAVGAAAWMMNQRTAPRVTRLALDAASPQEELALTGNQRDIAITPDGRRVVYVGGGGRQLLVRSLDRAGSIVLVNAAQPRDPVISPDGQWVAYFNGNDRLERVALAGGPVETVYRGLLSGSRGMTWGDDDSIIFSVNLKPAGLRRVSSSGGDAELITSPPDGESHRWPAYLPGGRAVLFTVRRAGEQGSNLMALDLRTGEQRVIARGANDGRFVASGHLVYSVNGSVWAAAFDPDRLEVIAPASEVLSNVAVTGEGAANISVAQDGTLAYAVGNVEETARAVVWFDRQGRPTAAGVPAALYSYARLSPDGRRVALDSRGTTAADINVWDLERQALTRVTFAPSADVMAVWTPDARRLIFSSGVVGRQGLWWIAANGSGKPEPLTADHASPAFSQWPTSVSPDGTRLIYEQGTSDGTRDIMELRLDGTRQTRALIQTPTDEREGRLSPDGQWLAYESDETGRGEIFVRAFPDVEEGRWQVTMGGGILPVWSRTGRELFYQALDGALMRVDVAVDRAAWTAAAPVRMFESNALRYDIAPDGTRFLMITRAVAESRASVPKIIVVQNWFEELKRLVPAR